MQDKYKHPPGDPQAVADGCTYPMMDNANGKGCGYVDGEGFPLYVFDLECPLHRDKAEEMDPETLCFDAGEYAEIMGANASWANTPPAFLQTNRRHLFPQLDPELWWQKSKIGCARLHSLDSRRQVP